LFGTLRRSSEDATAVCLNISQFGDVYLSACRPSDESDTIPVVDGCPFKVEGCDIRLMRLSMAKAVTVPRLVRQAT
jgi:hypothetical protein